jgi:hypothetical protein
MPIVRVLREKDAVTAASAVAIGLHVGTLEAHPVVTAVPVLAVLAVLVQIAVHAQAVPAVLAVPALLGIHPTDLGEIIETIEIIETAIEEVGVLSSDRSR